MHIWKFLMMCWYRQTRRIKIKDGTATTLTGIPLAIKDNILIKGRVASSASRILENYTASYDAHVIEKLKDSGAVFIGRTNMDEFAMGGSTENSAYGPTKIRTMNRELRGFIRRFCRRRCGRHGTLRPWFRYRRVYPTAGIALRHCGIETDIRSGVSPRCYGDGEFS